MNIITAQSHYNAGAVGIADSRENFVKFLNFHGRLFKNSTSDLIQIFAQAPDAEIIASADVWRKYGNPVKQGETGYVTADGGVMREFYDWSQTEQNKRPFQWAVSKDIAVETLKSYNDRNGRKLARFSLYIDDIVNRNVIPHINEYATILGVTQSEYGAFRSSFLSMVTQTAAARCEMNGAYISNNKVSFAALDIAKRQGKVSELITFAGTAAQSALMEIEKDIISTAALQAERAAFERSVKNAYDNRLSKADSRGGGVDERTADVLRTAVDKVYGGTPQSGLEQDVRVLPDRYNRAAGGQGSNGVGRPAGRTVQEAEPAADERKFRGEQQVQQHQGNVHTARGDGTSGVEVQNGRESGTADTGNGRYADVTERTAIIIRREPDNSLTIEMQGENERTAPGYEGYSFVYGTFSEEAAAVAFDSLQDDFDNKGYIWRAADERFLRERDVKIEQEDIDKLRAIEPKRKSVLNFSNADVTATKAFDDKAYGELSVKSAYERRREGDRREFEETRVPIIRVDDRKVDFKTVQKDIKSKAIERNPIVNNDTGWEIQITRKGLEETYNFADRYERRDKSGEVFSRLNALYQLDEILANSIFIDSRVSEPSGKNKADSTLFMHHGYNVVTFDNKPMLMDIGVEEYGVPNGGNTKRLYCLKHIKITPLNTVGLNPKEVFNGVVTDKTIPLDRMGLAVNSYAQEQFNGISTISIAQIYSLVKTFDKDFFLNKPERADREQEMEAEARLRDEQIRILADELKANEYVQAAVRNSDLQNLLIEVNRRFDEALHDKLMEFVGAENDERKNFYIRINDNREVRSAMQDLVGGAVIGELYKELGVNRTGDGFPSEKENDEKPILDIIPDEHLQIQPIASEQLTPDVPAPEPQILFPIKTGDTIVYDNREHRVVGLSPAGYIRLYDTERSIQGFDLYRNATAEALAKRGYEFIAEAKEIEKPTAQVQEQEQEITEKVTEQLPQTTAQAPEPLPQTAEQSDGKAEVAQEQTTVAEKLCTEVTPRSRKSTAYYLFRNPESTEGTAAVLSNETLALIDEKADNYVICADICCLSKASMAKFNIKFRKMPRDLNLLPDNVREQILAVKPEYEEQLRNDPHQTRLIGQGDIDKLRAIEPKRKSVLNFVNADVVQAAAFEDKAYGELGEKSAYERRRDGDWRETEDTRVPIIQVDYRPTNNVMKDLKSGVIKRGTFVNEDTGYEIIVGRTGIEDTLAHAIIDVKRDENITV